MEVSVGLHWQYYSYNVKIEYNEVMNERWKCGSQLPACVSYSDDEKLCPNSEVHGRSPNVEPLIKDTLGQYYKFYWFVLYVIVVNNSQGLYAVQ